MSDLNEHNVKCTKFACIVIAVVFTVLISSIAGYNIHSTAYESQNITVEIKLVQARMELGSEQNEAIRALISGGLNPIAARCAIVGWVRESGTSLCASFVRDSNRLRD